MKKDIIYDIVLHRVIEMLLGCVLPSVFICSLCVSGPMPVGSIQRDITLIGAPVAFIVWNIIMLRRCYVAFVGERTYYIANICAYVVFTIVNLCAYIFLPTDAYTWIFVITRLGRYTNLGITSPVGITIFHFIAFISIFLAPIGLGWIKMKVREEEELLERAPGILEVNPLEQKKDSMEVSTNEDKEKKEENSLP